MKELSADILKVILTPPQANEPKTFYFLGASSGNGKSQTAQSFEFPVVYLPLVTTQFIYKCFATISVAVNEALKEDFEELSHERCGDVMEKVSSATLYATQTEFRTVGLLVQLFLLVCGKTNAESIKLLSGRDSSSSISYKKMKLQDARAIIATHLPGVSSSSSSSSGGGAAQSNAAQQQQARAPMFMIDEAPPLSKKEEYKNCILLRNLIRCMDCVCLLCGTEAAAMNTIDSISLRSRGDTTSREYLRLITTLPPTNWEVLQRVAGNAAVMADLSDDVREMLLRTRPLFVEHVLEAMLSEAPPSIMLNDGGAQPLQQQQASSGAPAVDSMAATAATRRSQLTSRVLSLVKRKIMDRNFRFSSRNGLYAQTMLVHSQFLARPIDTYIEEQEAGLSHKRKKQKLLPEQREQLMGEAMSCVRNHYGEMRPANTGIILDRPLPLFVRPGEVNMYVEIKLPSASSPSAVSTTLNRFLPNVVFAKPCDDELLYLVCLRDGLVLKEQRVSSSYALRSHFVSKEMEGKRANNTKAPACSGRFLENEVITAAVVASHSFGGGLSGCPLSFFLRATIAELNIEKTYVAAADFALGVPPHYEKIHVGLLSAVNSSWQKEGASRVNWRCLQEGSVLLTDIMWSANKDQNDASFSVKLEEQMHQGSLEMKCWEDTTDTAALEDTIKKNGQNGHLITIMVVNKGANIQNGNVNFHAAKLGHNVIRISGDASQESTVSKVLTWNVIYEHVPATLLGTVVQVELDAIYWGRYDMMRNVYRST